MRIQKAAHLLVLVAAVSGFCLHGQVRKVQRTPHVSTIEIRDVAVSIFKNSKGTPGIQASIRPLLIHVQNRGNVNLKNVVVHLYLKPAKVSKSPMVRRKPYLQRIIKMLAAGESRQITITSPSRLTATPEPAGRYRLIAMADPLNRIREKDEKNNRDECDWVIMARITKVQDTPTGESYGGELFPEITLMGEKFGSPASNRKVHIGQNSQGITAAFPHDWNDTSIFLGLGPSMACGVYAAYLSESGVRISNKVNFILKCWISEALPMAGAAPRTEVEIHGRNFGHTQDGRIVSVGGVSATVISWSMASIRFRMPSLAPGSYNIRIKKGTVDHSFGLNHYNAL